MVTESNDFIDDFGADSFDAIQLAMSFEDEFGCEILEEATDSILTVGDAIKFLEAIPKK